MTRTRRHPALPIAVAVLAAVTATACSGQSASARQCDRLDGVRSAVDELQNVSISENGMVAVQEQLAQVKTELQLLRIDAATAVQPHVDALTLQVDAVRLSAHVAAQNPTPSTLAAAGRELRDLRTQLGTLRSEFAGVC